jgi:hypothetical protein
MGSFFTHEEAADPMVRNLRGSRAGALLLGGLPARAAPNGPAAPNGRAAPNGPAALTTGQKEALQAAQGLLLSDDSARLYLPSVMR